MATVQLLAHCGAKWWLCDVGSAVAFVLIVVFIFVGMKRLEKRAEKRVEELRREQAARRAQQP